MSLSFYCTSYGGENPGSRSELRANFSSCKASDGMSHQENSLVCHSWQTVSSPIIQRGLYFFVVRLTEARARAKQSFAKGKYADAYLDF